MAADVEPKDDESAPAGDRPADEREDGAPPTRPAPPVSPRRRLTKLLLLVVGLGIALYFGAKAPREQHVRIVLGDYAPTVTAIELTYIGDGADVAREARFSFEPGGAPRILSHEPKLADGDYRLKIDVDTREGRRSTERRVTLGGGSTQLEVTDVLRAGSAPRAP